MIQNEKDAFFKKYAYYTDANNTVLEIIWQAKQSRATRIDLDDCGLSELPDALFELVWLEELFLCSYANIFNFEKQIWEQFRCENHIFNFNCITYISPKISQLKKLKTFVISSSLIRSLGYSNEKELFDISSLKSLINLETLIIDSINFYDLNPLKNIFSLKFLRVSNTKVSDLSPLRDLINLQILDISNTKVSDLSPLKDSITLQQLDVHNTKVSDLSPLKDLITLQQLDVHNTKVSDLSPLKDLITLQKLDVSSTQVSNLNPLKGLTALMQLVIRNCQIQYIPKEIYDQWYCINDLKAYWQDQSQSQTTINNQLKIMFLGNGCVGKTTLLHWFLDNEFKDLSLEDGRTHGIIIQPYPFKESDVLAHFWDFGGQEVYHATHRLFFGRRSLYLLVWATESPDAAHEERHPPQYWLDMIADIAGKERSRVLIVQNLFDGQTERNILTDAERQDYEKRGLDITTYCVNAKTGVKIKSLKTAIEEEAEQLIKTNIEELPTSWVNIRKAVADKRLAKDKTLARAEFENICRDCELTTNPNVILGYLHHAGELFHYNNQFENQIILDQKWALKAVYALLKRDKIERFKGLFTLADLVEVWQKDNPNLTNEEARIFLNFMLANKTLFYTEGASNEHSDNPEFVVPQLLPIEKPKMYSTWQKIMDKTCYRIQYPFLHRDIIERFIIATAHLSKDKDYWRNGLFIDYGEDQAVVEVIEENGIKYIQIECIGSTQTQLLKTIREEFNKIRTLDKAKEYRLQNDKWVQVTGEIIQRAEDMGGFKNEAPTFVFPKEDIISSIIKTGNSMKQHLESIVAKGKLTEALALMSQLSGTQNRDFQTTVILLSAQNAGNENDNLKGITEESSYRRTKARLNQSILSLLESEFDERKVPPSFKIETKEAERNPPIEERPIPPKVDEKAVSSRLKILMLTANPSGTAQLKLKDEHSNIAFKLQNKQEQFDLLFKPAVSDTEFKEFTETIKPDILHFSGHGENGKYGGIIVQNDDKNGEEMISVEGLDALFEYFKEEGILLKAVILNACHTEIQAKTISKHVPYVLGTTVDIGDLSAIAFSSGFYFKLAEPDTTIEQAFKSGRTQAVMKKASKSHFVIYKDGVKLDV